MSSNKQASSQNLLLSALAAEDYARLQSHLDQVELRRGSVLVPANAPVDHVYFPEDGVVSIVLERPGKKRTEVGIFGREGMSATFLLLGASNTPHVSFVQVAGASALRIETARFVQAVEQSASLQATLLRYVQTMIVQKAQNAAMSATLQVEARLARWLLMCHGRVKEDEIAVTHETIAMMITAQRTGVTQCLSSLERQGMILTARGRVIIQNRATLLKMAGDGYGMAEDQYRKLLGPFGK